MAAAGSIRTQRAPAATCAQCARTSSQRSMAGGYGQRVRPPLLLALLALLAVVGCGGDDRPAAQRDAEPVTLSLDFTPNAVHAPIYAATRDGRDTREGVDLQIRRPGPGPDALKLITAGKVDLGVLDI